MTQKVIGIVMHRLFLLLFLASCSTTWFGNFFSDKYESISVAYYKLELPALLSSLEKNHCLKIRGIPKNILLRALNLYSDYFYFSECLQDPTLISFESSDESKMGLNENAAKLKPLLSDSTRGTPMTSILLITSIGTFGEMVKAAGYVKMQHQKATIIYPFQTEAFEMVHLRNAANPKGKIDINQEIVAKTQGYIWYNLNSHLVKTVQVLKFDVEKKYYKAFIEYLKKEDYLKALTSLDQIKKDNPGNADIYFNIGILSEYYMQYEKALESYTNAVKLNYNPILLEESIKRVKGEIDYRNEIKSINPKLMVKFKLGDKSSPAAF